MWEDEDIEEMLVEHIDREQLYFLQEFRNYLNHAGEIDFMFKENDGKIQLQIGLDRQVVADLRSRTGEGSKIEKGIDYYRKKHDMDLEKDIRELYDATAKVDKQLLDRIYE